MEQNQQQTTAHPWNMNASCGDEALLGLLARQDEAWRTGAEQLRAGYEIAEHTRAEIRSLGAQILARQREIGVDPHTVGASLDQLRGA